MHRTLHKTGPFGRLSADGSPSAVWTRRQSMELDLRPCVQQSTFAAIVDVSYLKSMLLLHELSRSDICVEDRVDLTGVLCMGPRVVAMLFLSWNHSAIHFFTTLA